MLLCQAHHYCAFAKYHRLLYQDVCTVSYHFLSLLLKFHIYFSLVEGDCISSTLSYVLSLRCILCWHSLYVVIPNHARSFSDLLLCFVYVISKMHVIFLYHSFSDDGWLSTPLY